MSSSLVKENELLREEINRLHNTIVNLKIDNGDLKEKLKETKTKLKEITLNLNKVIDKLDTVIDNKLIPDYLNI